MSVGAPQDKNAIDMKAYLLCQQVRDVLIAVQNFNAFLATKTTAQLVALGYDETTLGEVTLLKNAFIDLDNLRLTATGQRTQPSASNFLSNSNKLVGPN